MGLTNTIKQYIQEIDDYVVNSKEDLEQYRITFLGSKNKIKSLFNEFKALSAEEKKSLGKELNLLKQLAEKKFRRGRLRLVLARNSEPNTR